MENDMLEQYIYFLYYQIPTGGKINDLEEFKELKDCFDFITSQHITTFTIIKGTQVVNRSNANN